MKKKLGIITTILAGAAGIAGGIYATYKMNKKYKDYKSLKNEIDSIPWEVEGRIDRGTRGF